ncbi:uncharacterized protein LOC100871126 [Apis florea]|uniref:uncharacterized protein LOC100871126 n=1 Tax=Apis florea TaxID=7463 RepID=UPI000629A10B|nr:uncharacterized protein LOC100871126 [Apis florea]
MENRGVAAFTGKSKATTSLIRFVKFNRFYFRQQKRVTREFMQLYVQIKDSRCYRLCPSSYGYRMRKDQISSGLTLFFTNIFHLFYNLKLPMNFIMFKIHVIHVL